MLILLKFLKPFYKQMVLLALLFTVQTVCTLFLPYLMSDIVELGIRAQSMTVVWQKGAIMISLAFVAMVFTLLANRVASDLSARYSVDMHNRVFNKINSLSFSQFGSIGTGSLLTRATDDIAKMEDVIVQLPYVFVGIPVMFVGGVVLCFLKDWVLAVILLAVSPFILIIITAITKNINKYWERAEVFTDAHHRIIRERLSGIRVIRAFDRDKHEHNRAEYATQQMCNSFVAGNTMSGLVNPVTMLLLNLSTVAIIYVGNQRIMGDAFVDAGDVLSAIQYIAFIGNSLLMLSWVFAFAPQIHISNRRIAEVLDMPTAVENVQEIAVSGGTIKFDKVSFRYDGSNVDAVSDATFSIGEGGIVGIIGGTGSGKTTLAKLIMNFYPCQGYREMAGVDYNATTQKAVRDNISMALQKSMIFQGTLQENVKMGNKDSTAEQVNKVLEISQLSEFVNSHEEGLEYKLQQAGSNLSGGQKQRVNIARAVLKNAGVYIFDDSFSALDYLTESKLRKALNKYLEGKTQIVITQRAATAMRCDKIIVMDEGRIVGQGTHLEMLKECQVYREIYRSQLGGDVE